MSRKLKKWERIETLNMIKVVLFGLLGFTILNALVILLKLPLLPIVLTGFFPILALIAFVAMGIQLLVRYFQTMHGDEAFLTHSLPLKTAQIFRIKSSWIFKAVLLFVACILICLLILFIALIFARGMSIGETVSGFVKGFLYAHWAVHLGIISLVAFFLLGLYYQLQLLLFSMTLGMNPDFRDNGIGAPIVIYFVGNFIGGLFALMAMFLIPIAVRFPQRIHSPDDLNKIALEFRFVLPDYIQAISEGTEIPSIGLGLIIAMILMIVFLRGFILRELKNRLVL